MKRITKSVMPVFKNTWIKFLVIPFILLLFWIAFSLLLNPYISFTTLTQNYNMRAITQMPQGKLMKGESINGEFKATEPDLGIVSVRFTNHRQVTNVAQDILVFGIKEKGVKTWQYQNTYKSNSISSMPFYPFGFPQFINSKGKTYIFSIISLQGNEENALQLSRDEPILVSKYVFTKSELLANENFFTIFVVKKFIESFTDIRFIESSLIFGLPLFFYLMWVVIFNRIQRSFYKFHFSMPLLIIIMIVLNIDTITGIFWGIIGVWIIIVTFLDIESGVSFFFALLFFILAFGSVLIGYQDLAGRISNWTYMFLVIGAAQLFMELISSQKKNELK